MEWKRAVWTLIPVASMSMLTVLFLVLWQAIGHQTSSINGLQQRLSELEQLLQERPSANDALLDQQLQQLQKNQRELEDRISRTALQHTELLELAREGELLLEVHAAAGRLLAVAQRGVEDANRLLAHGVIPD